MKTEAEVRQYIDDMMPIVQAIFLETREVPEYTGDMVIVWLRQVDGHVSALSLDRTKLLQHLATIGKGKNEGNVDIFIEAMKDKPVKSGATDSGYVFFCIERDADDGGEFRCIEQLSYYNFNMSNVGDA